MADKNLQLSADTSSLILLHKANLLKKYANFLAFHVSNHVYDELNRTAPFEPGIKLIIHKMSNSISADKSVVHILYRQNLDAVLSDDAGILKKCKKNNITHYCCLSLSAILALQNHMSKQEAQQDMDELLKFGRYSDWITNYAFQMLE